MASAVTRDWAELARRVVLAAAAGAAALLVLAMLLSYSGLRAFYTGCGFGERAAAAAPLCVDLLALVAYVAWLALGGWYPGALVAGTVAASAAAQGYHVAAGGITAQVTSGPVLYASGASAILCAGLAGHLFFKILSRSLPVDFLQALRDGADHLYPQEQPWATPPTSSSPSALAPPPTGRGATTSPALSPPTGTPAADETELVLAGMGSRPVGSSNGSRPRLHRPTVTRSTVPRETSAGPPSQATGPCVPGCTHHRGPVSKSTRYRCAPGGTCPTCNPRSSQ